MRHYCGGTILDENTILTAAHCNPDTSKDYVVYGTNKRVNLGDLDQVIYGRGGGKIGSNAVGIKSVQNFGHKSPGTRIWMEDWLILKVKKPIKLGPNAQPVELGTYDEFVNHVLLGKKKCTIIGNGKTDFYPKYSDTLMEGKTQLSVHQSGPNAPPWFRCGQFTADPRKFEKNCVVFANTDNVLAAPGDSGGPLFCDINGKMKQFGVASFAMPGESTDKKNGVHSYAATFVPDIQKHLQKWNPKNRVPADFRGMDELITQYKKNPGSIKTAGSSQRTSSSRHTGYSRESGSSRKPIYSQHRSRHQQRSSANPAPSQKSRQSNVNPCAPLNWCNGNGNGDCAKLRSGGAKCYCKNGYKGKDCKEKEGGSSANHGSSARQSQHHHRHQQQQQKSHQHQSRHHQVRQQKPQESSKIGDPCAALNWCNRNGHCAKLRSGEAKCICKKGFHGKDCNEKEGGSGHQSARQSQQFDKRQQQHQNRGHKCNCKPCPS